MDKRGGKPAAAGGPKAIVCSCEGTMPLDLPGLEIGTVSATSAGAVNAVALASGLATGGRVGAKATLRAVWEAIGRSGIPRFLRFNPLVAGFASLQAMASSGVGPLAGALSPYEFNPFDFNPLRTLLEENVDFAAIRARQPVRLIWGVGPAFGESLAKDGFATIGDLQKADPAALARRYGELGLRLARLANGEDARAVSPSREAKTVSAETTFNQDIGDLARLEDMLWGLCEKVARRMKADGLAGRTVTLKLKSPDFRILTRRTTLARSSNLARTLFAAAQPLLREAHEGRRWRLIGVGYSDLAPATEVQQAELFDAPDTRLAAQEAAIDRIRERFGNAAIGSGRSLRKGED